MPNRDIVVVGASAGGVEALTRFVHDLPPDLPAAIFIVLHTMPGGHGLLAQILARHAKMPVSGAHDRQKIRKNNIYVAPPDFHLLLTRTHVKLSAGPTHNRNRPAIDPLFQSAAAAFNSRVVGIVLTGFLDDGSEGIAAIQEHGGYTIIQDPADSLVPSMPKHALMRIRPDACVALSEMGPLLGRVCREPIQESVMVQKGNGGAKPMPTTITCPECGGVINESDTGNEVKFQCQVGHSFTPNGLMAAQNDSLEHALWAAIRSLEEGASLSRKMAKLSEDRKRIHATELYRQNAAEREQHARVLKDLIERFERHDREAEIYEGSA